LERVGHFCQILGVRTRPILGQNIRFHLIVLVLTFESVVVVSARETTRDALPVL